MYFAWKDDNFLIKILTTIMIFIVVMLVVISPVFASSDLEGDEISVVFHDNILILLEKRRNDQWIPLQLCGIE